MTRMGRDRLQLDVLRPHFETLVLVFPDGRGIDLEQLRHEFGARERQQCFHLDRRLLERAVVVPRRFCSFSSQWATACTGAYSSAQLRISVWTSSGKSSNGTRCCRNGDRAAPIQARPGSTGAATAPGNRAPPDSRRGEVTSRLSQICRSCPTCAANRYAATNGCESRQPRPATGPVSAPSTGRVSNRRSPERPGCVPSTMRPGLFRFMRHAAFRLVGGRKVQSPKAWSCLAPRANRRRVAVGSGERRLAAGYGRRRKSNSTGRDAA